MKDCAKSPLGLGGMYGLECLSGKPLKQKGTPKLSASLFILTVSFIPSRSLPSVARSASTNGQI